MLRELAGAPERILALSFDDGPSEWTESILDALRDYGARASFFVIAECIPGREETLRRAVREGHEVGNHTTTHPVLTRKRRWSIRRELARGNAAIERAVGVPPRLFRPPFLAYDDAVLEAAADQGLAWTVLASDGVSPKDFKMDDADEIANAVVTAIRPGTILDLHDGRPPREHPGVSLPTRKPTADAVPLILSALIPLGYRIVSVSELFDLEPAP